MRYNFLLYDTIRGSWRLARSKLAARQNASIYYRHTIWLRIRFLFDFSQDKAARYEARGAGWRHIDISRPRWLAIIS